MAENLELRRDEFAGLLMSLTGCTKSDAQQEVDLSINRLFHWGAYADKYGGSVQVCLALSGGSSGLSSQSVVIRHCTESFIKGILRLAQGITSCR